MSDPLLDLHPLLLPHLPLASVRRGEIHLGGGEFKRLTPAERQFAAVADGRQALRQILPQHPEVAAVAPTFPYVLWWPRPSEPLPAARTSDRADLLVITAYPRDLVFSLGGFLSRQRRSACCAHLAVFSNQTLRRSELFRSASELEAVRRDEDNLVSRLLGVETDFLEYPDAGKRRAAGRRGQSEEGLKRSLAAALAHRIQALRPAAVFGPAGIGESPDHQLLAGILMEFHIRRQFPAVEFHLYENFPHCTCYQSVDSFMTRLSDTVARWSARFEDMSDTLSEKQLLCSILRASSQPPPFSIFAAVADRNARLARTERNAPRAAERFWTLAA